MLNKVRNTAARKLIQGKRENDAFSSFASSSCLRADVSYFLCNKGNRRRLHAGNSSSILFSLTSPSLGPHPAQIPKYANLFT